MAPGRRERHPGDMKTPPAFGRWSVEFVMTALLVAFLLLLAVRAFTVPAAAATGFGISVNDAADLFYVRVKGDRDLASALSLALLLALRQRMALAAFVGAAMVQPLCDLLLSVADERGRVGYALAVHGSAFVYCVVLVAVLLRRPTSATA